MFPFVVVGVQEGEWEINVTIGTIYGVNVTYLLGTNMVTQTDADRDLDHHLQQWTTVTVLARFAL